jgi:hypothetical protein
MRTVRLVKTLDMVMEICQEDIGENDILEDLTEEELFATAWDMARIYDFADWILIDSYSEER